MGIRKPLPPETLLQIHGNLYRISGDIIGYGGGSIIYPAERLTPCAGGYKADGMEYALKESFPISGCTRNERWEIVPENQDQNTFERLSRAKKMQLEEGKITAAIYRTASRMLPIRDAADTVICTIPGENAEEIHNTVTVMDSLAGKGRSLSSFLKEYKRFPAVEAFRVLQQVLFGLQEIHNAGYLHLDIQAGNIFLQGSLENKGEFVSFIDFGSSRKMENGKTAPIIDRVIFSTDGFTAPEIFLSNDGSLCLTPAADIFSAGCLAYYMLTGTKLKGMDVIYHREGDYLNSSQLRRMKCARHLYPKIQFVLRKALETDPEKRYPSVDAMLADVSELAEAVQPYRSDLKDILYDAFVCYKHGPIDSEAAVVLQRQLEHFRTANGYRGKRKPFSRVFVDEGELSSCSDFGATIQDALKNSGWLIVICSQDTPSSPWVTKEIETFLEYHDRSRILAVLTGGNPTDSFPALLRAGSDTSGEILAADARGERAQDVLKKIKGDALLKIAAPMLGTTFDTLKDRQKIYKLQRAAGAAAVFATAAIGFTAYAVNRANVIAAQNVTIQIQADELESEYRKTLLNESRFLTEQARKRLDDNDPLGALELALEAMPSAKQADRPILPETEYVLGKALGVYSTPASMAWSVSPVGVIDPGTGTWCLNSTGEYLLAIPQNYHGIQVWNTATGQLVHELLTNYIIEDISPSQILDETNSIIVNSNDGNNVYCIDFLSGTTKWSICDEGIIGISVSEDKTHFALIRSCNYSSYGENYEMAVQIHSSQNGCLLNSISFVIPASAYNNGYLPIYNSKIFMSPDETQVAIITNISSDDVLSGTSILKKTPKNNTIIIVNMDDGSTLELFESDLIVKSCRFFNCGFAVIRDSSATIIAQNGSNIFSLNKPNVIYLELYDRNSGKLLKQIVREGLPSDITQFHIDMSAVESENERIYYLFGNSVVCIDAKSLQEIFAQDYSSPIVHLCPDQEGYTAVTSDGSYITQRTASFYAFPFWDHKIHALEKRGDLFFVSFAEDYTNNHKLSIYQQGKANEEYTSVVKMENDGWEEIITGTQYIYLVSSSRIAVLSTQTGLAVSYSFEQGQKPVHLLGGPKDGSRLYWSSNTLWRALDESERGAVFSIEAGTGTIRQVPSANIGANFIEDAILYQDTIYYILKSSQEIISLWAMDCLSGKTQQVYQCGTNATYLRSSLFNIPESGEICFAVNKQNGIELVKINPEKHQTTELIVSCKIPSEQVEGEWIPTCFSWSKYGETAAIGIQNSLLIIRENGETATSIQLPDVGSYCWTAQLSTDGNVLYLISDDGLITSYHAKDGSKVCELDLQKYAKWGIDLLRTKGFHWTYLDDSTILLTTLFDGGFLLSAKDGELTVTAKIEDCIGYDTDKDRFYTANLRDYFSSTMVGYFPRYSAADLIYMGQELIGITE